jgi:serine protease Do
MDDTSGVRIDDVDRDSPAEKAGLREGDIITEFDGERVRSARQFTRLVQETPDGRSVKIGILRGGQKQMVEATPEASTFSWNFDFDRDKIRREFESGMRELDGLREFRAGPRGFAFGEMFGAGVPRGRLGVTVEPLTEQLQEYFGAKEGGVLVSSVTAGSAAEKAGLKAGDVITTINGDRVADTGDLIDELAQTSGTEVTIGIVRDKKASTLKATVEPRSRPREMRPRQPAAFVRPV